MLRAATALVFLVLVQTGSPARASSLDLGPVIDGVTTAPTAVASLITLIGCAASDRDHGWFVAGYVAGSASILVGLVVVPMAGVSGTPAPRSLALGSQIATPVAVWVRSKGAGRAIHLIVTQ